MDPKFLTGRMSRRLLAKGAAVGTATAALRHHSTAAHGIHSSAPNLIGLRQGGSANIPTPREQTLVIDMGPTNIYDSFNPYVPNGEATASGVHQLCRECFFYVDFTASGDVIPWLASGYSYNPDYTEFTMTLDPNAAWSDGTPLTADDVLFTFDLLRRNEELYGSSTISEGIAEATAPDAHTVVMKLTEPSPRFLYNFVGGVWTQWIRLVPKHVWEGQDPGTFKNNPPVWSGPYVLEEAIPQQFMYIWRKNPSYWNKAKHDPKPEYVVYRQALPVEATIQEFTRGNIDIPSLDALTQPVVAASYDQIAQAQWTDPCPRGLNVNFMSPTRLFEKPEGRWAISYLLDRQKIAETIWQPPSRPAAYPWADWANLEKFQNPSIQAEYDVTAFDPDRAVQLLDSIGATMSGDRRQLNGQELNLNLITPSAVGQAEYQIGQLLADEARKIGLDITVTYLQTFGDAFANGDFDIASQWICGAGVDVAPVYANATADLGDDDPNDPVPVGERAVGNESRINIPELYEVVEKLSQVAPDAPEAKPLYDEALELYLKNMCSIPAIQTIYPFTFNTAYWTGWPTTDDLYNVPNWDWAHFNLTVGRLQPASGQ